MNQFYFLINRCKQVKKVYQATFAYPGKRASSTDAASRTIYHSFPSANFHVKTNYESAILSTKWKQLT